MTLASSPRSRPPACLPPGRRGWPTLVLAGTLLLLLVPLASAAPSAAGWSDPPLSWSNGLVLCEFAPSSPTVAVSALARAGTGVSSTVGSISEAGASGALVSTSNLSSAGWTTTNLSTDSDYDLDYAAQAAVTKASTPYTVLGSVGVRVDFGLPMYAGLPSGSTDTVAVNLLISGWPWQATSDHLALTLTSWPSYAGEEHLLLGSSPGTLLSAVSTPGGVTFEQMSGSTSAVANPGSASPVNVAATPSASGNSSLATVSVTFGATAGGFSALSYSASVRVLFPASVAGIPILDLLAVGGIAALITILVASGARRMRARPSDLVYADEGEA